MSKKKKRGLSRREFLRPFAAIAGGLSLAACTTEEQSPTATPEPAPTATPIFPNAVEETSIRLLWTGDIHGQLRPIYHREPFGTDFLEANGIEAGSVEAYLSSYENFEELAAQYGKVGGWAYLATLIKQEREAYPEKTILLDSGDAWYGSAICLLTEGKAAVDVMNAIGYDAMTLHWEFNLGEEAFLDRVDESNFAVLAQNLVDNAFEDRVLEPSIIKEIDGIRVAIVAEAYPFSMLTTEDRELTPNFRMGYRDIELQEEITRVRDEEGAEIVILLSHMGYEQDLVMAERLEGVNVIVGGHTHDILWQPNIVGETLVLQGGSHGKVLGELDLEVRDGKVVAYQHKLIPVLANEIEPDAEIEALIDSIYEPYEEQLQEVIGESNSLLYRRSLYGGTTDAFIGNAYREIVGSNFSCTGGWRFGATLLPGAITVEDVYNVMKPTPTPIFTAKLTGSQIRNNMEDNFDNVFSDDPLQRLGGDVLRCTGISVELKRNAERMERVVKATVNGEPLDSEAVYTVATSGGRTQTRDPEYTETDRSATEELIDYIRENSPITADEPVNSFTEVD